MSNEKIDWSQYEEPSNNNGDKIDWSQYEAKENGEENSKQSFPASDKMPPHPAELTGLTGVAFDTYESLINALSNAADFSLDIPNKLEKSGKYIEEHPGSSILHNAGQVGVVAADLAKGIVNAPHDLFKYLKRKNLAFDIPIPGTNWTLSDLMPHIPENQEFRNKFDETLGLKADPEKGDELFRALPNVLGGGSLVKSGIKGIAKGVKGTDLKEVIRNTQSKVNEATANSGKIFDTIEDEVKSRGISKVPVKKDVINQAEAFLATTPANKALIARAKTGEYKALRQLQADLRVKGEKALSSAFSAENTMGEEILSTRDQVNKSIADHFKNTGNLDLSKLLNENREAYKNIQKTYFSTPALAKVFGKSQKVPKNPKTLLTEESTEMNKFMTAHPEVQKALTKALKHGKNMKNLRRVLSVAGIGTSAEVAREILGGK